MGDGAGVRNRHSKVHGRGACRRTGTGGGARVVVKGRRMGGLIIPFFNAAAPSMHLLLVICRLAYSFATVIIISPSILFTSRFCALFPSPDLLEPSSKYSCFVCPAQGFARRDRRPRHNRPLPGQIHKKSTWFCPLRMSVLPPSSTG